MNEKEAMEKWCPVPMLRLGPQAVDATGRRHEVCKCIGSKCMMWRWESRHFAEPLTIDNPTADDLAAFPDWNGWCGLVKPKTGS